MNGYDTGRSRGRWTYGQCATARAPRRDSGAFYGVVRPRDTDDSQEGSA